MVAIDDELHHFGWNTCSSCHGKPARAALPRRARFEVGADSHRRRGRPAQPKLHKVIEPEEIAEGPTSRAPHTVHCLPGGEIMISMLGDAKRQRPRRVPAARREFESSAAGRRTRQG